MHPGHMVGDPVGIDTLHQRGHFAGQGGFTDIIDFMVQVAAHGLQPVIQFAASLNPAREQQHAHHRVGDGLGIYLQFGEAHAQAVAHK